jgi:hypothetical protein
MGPTAVQASADAQETLSGTPSVNGPVWIDHCFSFQCSAKNRPSLLRPTAVQAAGDAQDTAVSMALAVGVRIVDQRLPFQRSTSGASPVTGWSVAPTAMHMLGEAQETPSRPVSVWPTLGVVWIDQRFPIQRSASGPPLLSTPMAIHELDDPQDTPVN